VTGDLKSSACVGEGVCSCHCVVVGGCGCDCVCVLDCVREEGSRQLSRWWCGVVNCDLGWIYVSVKSFINSE